MAWKVNVSNFDLLIISTFVIKQILFFACINLALFYSTSFNFDILWIIESIFHSTLVTIL